MKEKIIQSALQLFMQYGIKNNTMDDIARQLGISKKTLYEHFVDKDNLVEQCITFKINSIQETILFIHKNSIDAVDELIKTSELISTELRGMNPAAMLDMKKHYPKAFELFINHKRKFVMKMVENNLKKGVEEGLYRDGMDIHIVALKRLYEVEMCMQPDMFPIENYNIEKVQLQIMDLFMHGISTLKGHKLINKYKRIKEED